MTSECYLMGIDGGGSNVRVAITTSELKTLAMSHGAKVNPSVIGYENAKSIIQAKMRETLTDANLTPEQIAGVGIGVAGAEAHHSEAWLREVITEVIPNAHLALSGDYEIALTGAIGERRGVLILAGTGSVSFGVNPQGQRVVIGGWGYLLGDEGGGYWLGLEAIKAGYKAIEGREQSTTLTDAILGAHNLIDRGTLIKWIYGEKRTAEIAQFAPIVLAHASHDPIAQDIVTRGAEALALMVKTVFNCLDSTDLPIAFAGSLLANKNPLSTQLCDLLGLDNIPITRYSPVIGATILALNAVKHAESDTS